jgi:uncharacterized protein (TIRG00374 family)
MRKLLLALVLLLGIIFIIARQAEVRAIFETLERGDWRFLFLAIGIEGLWLVNVAVSYKVIYRALGLEENIETLLLAAAGANFVNVVAPSAGVGGLVVFINTARQRGYSSARATFGGVLYLLFDYAGFLCILILGLIVLVRRHSLSMTDLIATVILVLIAVALASLLYLGTRSADALGAALAWMAQQINRILRPFIHRQYLSKKRAYAFAREAAEGLALARERPENLYFPVVLALSNKALLLSVLLLMFVAFGVPLSPGTLIAGFSIGYLFFIVSPTPAGIGIVEGTLTLALSSMYVPLGAAAVIALAYRGITFWMPLAFGGVALRWLGYRQN